MPEGASVFPGPHLTASPPPSDPPTTQTWCWPRAERRARLPRTPASPRPGKARLGRSAGSRSAGAAHPLGAWEQRQILGEPSACPAPGPKALPGSPLRCPRSPTEAGLPRAFARTQSWEVERADNAPRFMVWPQLRPDINQGVQSALPGTWGHGHQLLQRLVQVIIEPSITFDTVTRFPPTFLQPLRQHVHF